MTQRYDHPENHTVIQGSRSRAGTRVRLHGGDQAADTKMVVHAKPEEAGPGEEWQHGGTTIKVHAPKAPDTIPADAEHGDEADEK